MYGLGRLVVFNALTNDQHRDRDEAWRALHRRPDALPLHDDRASAADRSSRSGEPLRLWQLIARLGIR